MFTPPYHLFEGVLPEDVTAALRKEASRLRLSPGRVGYGQEVKEKRSSLVGFFPDDHWVHGIFLHYAALANNRSWRLPIVAPSGAQVAVYRDGSFFDWHSDNAPPREGDTIERKISVVINISGQTWSGGVLELHTSWEEFAIDPIRLSEHATPGSVAVFPSVAPHRVTPLTGGERITLTSWILGPIYANPNGEMKASHNKIQGTR